MWVNVPIIETLDNDALRPNQFSFSSHIHFTLQITQLFVFYYVNTMDRRNPQSEEHDQKT